MSVFITNYVGSKKVFYVDQFENKWGVEIQNKMLIKRKEKRIIGKLEF